MGYTVKIDPDSCISSGTCVADAPEAFGFDQEDIATPLPGAADLPDERLLRIARNCPAGAILLCDAEGNEIDLFAWVRNLILSGGVSHPLEATSALVAGVLAGEGIDSTVTEDIEAGLAALGDFDLLTVNALRWRMLAERFAPQRERFALSLSARARESIPAHLAGGRGILALHTAPICFDDWEEWRRVVGAAWNWERSRHPPLGPVRVSVGPGTHPITAGLEDFEVVDEVYGFMDYEADLDPLATSAHGGVDHPLLWAREVDGGRVVYDALGHDERSLSQPTHQEILRRAGRWLLDKG